MRLDRGLRIKLVASGETGTLERLRRLLPRERVGETYPRLRPCAARERRAPVLDRLVWLFGLRAGNDSADTQDPTICRLSEPS